MYFYDVRENCVYYDCEVIATFANEELAYEYAKFKNNQNAYFPITSVARGDLETQGFDATNVDDDTMTTLANKMGNAYTDSAFWIDLEIIAESLDIPKKGAGKDCVYCGKGHLQKGEYQLDTDNEVCCRNCWDDNDFGGWGEKPADASDKSGEIRRTFTGERYDITVVSDLWDGYFEIIAEHKESEQRSSVTNVNFMLANILAGDEDDPDVDIDTVEENYVYIKDPVKHKNVTERALERFQDRDWMVSDVEPSLDGDRSCGEWGDEDDDDEDDDDEPGVDECAGCRHAGETTCAAFDPSVCYDPW